ncbi:MAG: amylo-alpha-1,6-glucosidase [Candidatus Methylomirabilis sp.]|nr:amylo-alpha-1,6-glucosidase [Deltaproteobacteria bacterium]
MAQVSRIKDSFFIVATSTIIDPFRLIQKDGEIFGIYDRFGDILPLGKREQGVYYKGTRYLSHYELRINGMRPLFLSSNMDEDNFLMTVDLTNPDIYSGGELLLRRDSVHLLRARLLSGTRVLEHIRVRNFAEEDAAFVLELGADSDFEDIFEVRGLKRAGRGALHEPEYGKKEFRLSYDGLDSVRRTTAFTFSRGPDRMSGNTFVFSLTLKPNQIEEIYVTAECVEGYSGKDGRGYVEVLRDSRKRLRSRRKSGVEIFTSNEHFNISIRRSLADIEMMLTETPKGLFPYGGIPWYCTPFGRDGIITALECAWIKPDIAAGALKYLSHMQASEVDEKKAAEPGKIMHETRHGEMAALGEIPFGLYYGSVDATPLYIILAGVYWRRTGDTALIRKLWKSIAAALSWLDEYGDADGDGFLEYSPHAGGLRNQGWKDSQDSVFHRDGRLAEGPIALCEVQAYFYAAKKEAAALSRLMGDDAQADRLRKEAEDLKKSFNEAFWDEEMGTYVLALDGKKKPCRVVSSNAGHALFAGIADPQKARSVADLLLSESVFSGWGIRTIGDGEKRYNPMSYHNGSVWPHDNALTAFGLAAYGFTEHFNKVFMGIFDAALMSDLQRLPELFCGFQRRNGMAPTQYPVACAPQTWASGALLLMLHASLGIYFEADKSMIIFKEPELPSFLTSVYLKNLPVAPRKTVDILISRYGEDVTIEALKKPEDVHILIIK